MNLARLLGIGRPDRHWDEDPADWLPSRLELLAGATPELGVRVARNRATVLAAFVEGQAKWAASAPRFLAPRRVAFAVVTAILLVGLSIGGIAASSPGQPLFGVRLTVEELLLPAGAEARLLAQLDRLDRRLDELTEGVASGDEAAIFATLAAYREIVGEVEAGSLPQGTARETALDRVRSQLRRIEQLGAAEPRLDADAALGPARAMLGWLVGGGRDEHEGRGAAPEPISTVGPSSSPSSGPTSIPGGQQMPDAGGSGPESPGHEGSSGGGPDGGSGRDGHAATDDPVRR